MILSSASVAELCRRHGIIEMALFGSVLREDFSPSSDVDILVEFKPDKRVGFLKLGEIAEELEALVGRPVDLVTKESLSPLFRDEVLASREVVYVQT